MPAPFEPDQDVIDAVQVLIDEAICARHDSQSEETFIECRMCGEWEGHTDDCLMPLIIKWMGV